MECTYTSLTQNQQLLWVGQELNPESPMYNMVMTFEIKDTLSFPHFTKAFKMLVRKSDAMRSIFVIDGELPIQKYLNTIDTEVSFKDFSKETDPKKAYKTWESKRVTQLFDLTRCLFDCVLAKLAENHFIWYINIHHLITDGLTTTIIFSEMSELYAKTFLNNLNDVEELSKYQDFSVFAKEITQTKQHKEALSNWKEKQLHFPEAPALYHKKNNTLETASKRIQISIGKERTKKIQALASEKGVRVWTLDLSLYNIFLTALFAYLYRITGQENLLIGAPIHNRTSKNFKKTIGFFVEIFPLLTEIKDDETYMSLLKKIQLESNSFLKNAQTGTSSSALNRNFNVYFNYMMNAQNEAFNGTPVKTEWVHPGHNDPRHHIRLHVHDFDNTGELHLYFDLNERVFDTQQQLEVPQHFLNVLDAFIDDKNQEIKNVALITTSEISRIKTWNNTTVPYPENETLLSKFEAQVAQTPDAVAIVFENESLTYVALDHKSNQVAHFLVQKGIKNNDLIVVSLERSLEMMIYIYGILKAGAAYLPVDTQIPIERLDFIVKDASAKFLFYNHNNLNNSALGVVDCFHVTVINNEILSLDITPSQVTITPENLAYVIYTSGSTGEPKGVISHHKGICNRLNWMNDDYPLSQNDTLLQKTPITFDVSLWELFWALQVGAKLVIEVAEGHKNPDGLIKTIQENNISVIHFVPSMLTIFSQTEGVEACTSLDKIFCSGEALSIATVEKIYQKLPDVEIYNLYGPTEASVDVTSWHCKKEEISEGIPIGKPVANTKLYILDQKLQQLPIGIPGELYITGVQVAKGYINRKKLTDEYFLKNPFSSNSNATMYKTGDLVRYRPDGTIEYLGRTDYQVKIRGLRIELGEIEKTIEIHPAISQAIVTVDENDNLTAYYVGQRLENIEIIGVLEQRLPNYMIPSFYIYLDNFEFLSSGKVNRNKLPEFDHTTKTKRTKTQIAPQNEIEEIILNIWKDVMEMNKIGVNENFIQIGGNSLSAISITSRLRAVLELEMSITDVFNYPTIMTYAAYVEEVLFKLLNEQ